MSLDKNNTTILRMVWDCEFYYELLISITKVETPKVMAFLSSLLLRELTVFVQEMFRFVPQVEKAFLESSSKLFQKTYPIIRDRIHYFTSQPFDYENEKLMAESMLERVQSSFLTRPKDDTYQMRYDLLYLKVENVLCACSIDLYSLVNGTDIEKNGKVINEVVKQYVIDLSSVISNVRRGFSSRKLSKIFSLSSLCIENITSIELYNGKFDVAVSKSGFSDYLTIILLRLFSDIGSLLYFIKKLFVSDWENTYYLYFFTKLIAIRFDEISDAIYKIETEFPTDESSAFMELVKSQNIYPFPEDLRLVAKRLRNSIHYNPRNEIWNIDLSKTFYWYDNFLKQASTKDLPLKNWPNDYFVLKDRMLTHLELLHTQLATVFDHELVRAK